MRVFITGGAGFVGAALVKTLVARGETVAVLVRPTTSVWRLQAVLPAISVHYDLKDLHNFAPDVVVHTAWPALGYRHRDDDSQIAAIEPTLALVRAAHAAGCRYFIGLGSQAEYGPKLAAICEVDACAPISLYGASKLAAQLLTQQLCRVFQMRYVWVRLFSPYGPGDNPQFLIPSVIQTLLSRQCPALSAGDQNWDYLYIDDAASALASLVCHCEAAGVFNLGAGQVRSVRWIAEYIRDRIDPTLSLGFGEIPYRPDQSKLLQADISKLCAATGWRPNVSLEDGLFRTIQSYRDQHT